MYSQPHWGIKPVFHLATIHASAGFSSNGCDRFQLLFNLFVRILRTFRDGVDFRINFARTKAAGRAAASPATTVAATAATGDRERENHQKGSG